MAITQTNEYEIGVNNDLGNLANNVDNNRIGEDLTWLELDGSTIKVSVGSFIESQGNLYVVDTAAETPTGTAAAGAYLFFDDSVPGFVWSATAGTYDPARGGIYDGSDRRQCRWLLRSATTWDQLAVETGERFKLRIESDHFDSSFVAGSTGAFTRTETFTFSDDVKAVISIFTAAQSSNTSDSATITDLTITGNTVSVTIRSVSFISKTTFYSIDLSVVLV